MIFPDEGTTTIFKELTDRTPPSYVYILLGLTGILGVFALCLAGFFIWRKLTGIIFETIEIYAIVM